jgi:V8-like Glu-specific endopeptidase
VGPPAPPASSRTPGFRLTPALVEAIALLALFFPLGPAGAAAKARTTGEPVTLSAHRFSGTPTVGALFPPGGTGHTCTASVVASTPGDLLITAAHCIAGTGAGYRFAPAYHDGVEPFGSWTVVRAYGAPQWITRQDPADDFAILVVAPRPIHGHREEIQELTGAARLGSAPTPGERVTVPAYAFGVDDDPITCTAPVYRDGAFVAFNCTPYPGGTSGAPWLLRGARGSTVVGVIGGLHQGGCSLATSYSALFASNIRATLARAASGGTPSTFPPAGGDGCPAAA